MSKLRTIDTHTHILTQETAALLSKAGVKVTITPDDAEAASLDVKGTVYRPFPTGGFDIARRLRDMDKAGVDMHVLSATPQTYLYNLDAGLAAVTAAIQNDQIARHVAAHADRFLGIATLPMMQPALAADELTRAMTKLNLRGSMFASNVMGKNLDDPSFEPLWAAAEELGALLFIHPNNVAGADRLKSYYLVNLIGNPLDTTIAAACLVFGGVLDRHPKLKVMLAHGGGFTPYQAARWEHGWAVRPEPKKNVNTQPENITGRFFYDTILHSAPALEFMIAQAGADRVLLGSDYPYDMGMPDCVAHVRSLKIPEADKASILGGRAETLLSGAPSMNADVKPGRVPLGAVTGLIVDAMLKAGLAGDDAAKVAELMLEADLIGADAHGVFRLPQYVMRLKIGALNPRPAIKVERTAPATALVDGDNGMGHLVVARAAETAIELARECGVAWVGVRMSNHAGAAGVYAALPLKAGMIGIYSAVANANHMPLAGGAEPLLGTNPLAIAIPAGEEPPVVLDIATSIVSYGTIKNHRLQNRPLQADWMVDPETGATVTDPHKSAEALLLPMAGYKGAGLALMLGLLGGTLNGALFGRDCIDFNANPGAVTNTGQFVVALDPSRFQPLAAFKAEVDRHIRELRASKTLPGESVRLPGEQRARRRADRLAKGLALPGELLTQLDKLAGELAIKPLAAR